MDLTSRPHPSRIRLFSNPWLERTTLTPFLLFLSVWPVLLSLLCWFVLRHVGVGIFVGNVLLGLLVWPSFEYLAHRYLFHFEPSSARGQKLIFMLHMNHHVDPADPLRGLMPLVASIPLALAFWALFSICFGRAGGALTVGFVAGYVVYDTVHWACHQMPMRGGLFARLKRHHLRHHHAGQKANYAITAIFLDPLFRSGVKRR